MELRLLAEEDGLVQIECEGPVTQERLHRSADPLTALIGQEGFSKKVLLNLDKASFVDSSGVGWLLMCHKRCVQAGGRFVIYMIPPMVMTVLQLVQLPRIMPTAVSENEARVLAAG